MMKVNVYTKCDEVKLELNGKLIATQRSAPGSRFTYKFNVPYEAGELKAIAFSSGKEQAVKSLITTGPVEMIKIIPDRQVITSDRNDLAYLTVELSDAGGNRVPYAESGIKFHVAGDAVLAAVDNGNPRDPKSFQADSCNAWHGRCLVILRPTGRSGKVTLTAVAAGLPVEKCIIDIK